MTQMPSPDLWVLLAAVQDPEQGDVIGDIWQAAEVADVKPGTIRVWMTRGKVTPVLGEPGQEIFHLPTVKAAAEAGRKFKPRDPAANSRGAHVHARVAA